MKKALPFLLLLVLILIGFSLFFGLYEVKFFSSRATVSQASFSIDNSYVFVTPLQARANGQEKIRVTVFILNNQGLGVLGKKVFLAPNAALNIESIQGLTDSYGKAYFDVSASRAGEYYLEVKADDTALTQKAHLSFN
ncbi:hypothetical protein A2970_00750 [Candidatus Roizmanbacteria bacterium RIFCSPLOWO2_01_FULL_44_13]|uniref:Big-1 domain-containing protein n=1 Tax=Candidatus Roizmanbacteria bacterium RIFCSPLOWO2_01_FULL_44_13 TaxID=1802069 RepID=A0A1F7J8R9_9BACT|nr:MAG: hypothetical protein A2970_00750 [Candidatus Roizmanbacteria bacterium RIFCSPLOWO2_01_FULL_44_13]